MLPVIEGQWVVARPVETMAEDGGQAGKEAGRRLVLKEKGACTVTLEDDGEGAKVGEWRWRWGA